MRLEGNTLNFIIHERYDRWVHNIIIDISNKIFMSNMVTSNVVSVNTLNERLLQVLKNGKTRFGCVNPLHSYTSMTRTLPSPHSVCIRYVSNHSLHYVVYMLTQTLYSMILFSFHHSGSTCVQVVIGTRWNDSDLDIICTDDATPIVRSWLLGADVNQIFCGHTEVSLLKGMLPCLCISILLGVP